MNIIFIIIPIILILIKVLMSRPDLKGGDIKTLLSNGAKVIDVRTQSEFRSGHIKDALNIPLSDITNGVRRHGIEKNTPVILYCASGARSASAKRFLAKEGYTSVYNGGTLHHLSKLKN